MNNTRDASASPCDESSIVREDVFMGLGANGSAYRELFLHGRTAAKRKEPRASEEASLSDRAMIDRRVIEECAASCAMANPEASGDIEQFYKVRSTVINMTSVKFKLCKCYL
jgi:hypothetical protein